MWQFDQDGTELPGVRAALEALRARARRAIAEADAHGVDVRQVRVRLRDESGSILFEGTTEQAASIDLDGGTATRHTLPLGTAKKNDLLS